LKHFGISLLVTTYQAGKLVIVRADGGRLNTHFRGFNKPMGLAVDHANGGNRLAIGTAVEIWNFHNVPAVGRKLEPVGKHDACFLPRGSHTTGDVQIHEMEWVGGELLFVNTRFSCLCTVDGSHSFVPRWRPPFISGLAPEDRCHLNGLGLAPDERGVLVPRFATALGQSDSPAGWRPNKKDGGILMELPSGTIITRGLSMPHSPRWHDGRLWLLESGTGGVGLVDLQTGRYQSITELPGFTRGFDFHGGLAFIGLSQVRETAVFSGISLTERLAERTCGVWVIEVRSGRTVAFLRFEDAVQEIFAVSVLPGKRFPDLINDDPKLIADSFVLPDAALRDVPGALRAPVDVHSAASDERGS
jgi:uncharacterized protein (TIGR03032 family)